FDWPELGFNFRDGVGGDADFFGLRQAEVHVITAIGHTLYPLSIHRIEGRAGLELVEQSIAWCSGNSAPTNGPTRTPFKSLRNVSTAVKSGSIATTRLAKCWNISVFAPSLAPTSIMLPGPRGIIDA